MGAVVISILAGLFGIPFLGSICGDLFRDDQSTDSNDSNGSSGRFESRPDQYGNNQGGYNHSSGRWEDNNRNELKGPSGYSNDFDHHYVARDAHGNSYVKYDSDYSPPSEFNMMDDDD